MASEKTAFDTSGTGGALHALVDREVHRKDVVLSDGEARTKTPFRVKLGIFVMALNCLQSVWAPGLIGTQSTFIAQDIGGLSVQSWYGNCVLIGETAVYVLAYYISDRIGRKIPMMFGSALGVIGSIIGATAHSPAQIIVGLVIMGMGVGINATYIPAALDVGTVYQRGLMIGCIELGSVLGIGTQATIGAAAATSGAGWRALFYVNIALFAMNFVTTGLFYNPIQKASERLLPTLMGVDWISIILMTGIQVLVLYGLAEAESNPWSDGHVIGGLAAGFGLIVPLCLWSYWHKNSILNRSLITFFNFPMVCFQAFIGGFLLFGYSAFGPSYIAFLFSASQMRTAVLQWPQQGVFMVMNSIFSSSVTFTKGHFRPQWIFGLGLAAIGLGLCSTLKLGQSPSRFLGYSSLIGFGIAAGGSMPAAITSYALLQKDLGIGMALVNSWRAIGGCICIASCVTILSNRVKATLAGNVIAAVTSAGWTNEAGLPALIGAAAEGAAALSAIPGITPQVEEAALIAVGATFQSAYHHVYWFLAGMTAFGALVPLAMHPIKKERMTNRVPVQLGRPLYDWKRGIILDYEDSSVANSPGIHDKAHDLHDEEKI